MKKLIFLILLAKVFIIQAQRFNYVPFAGLGSYRFVGNGTAQSTSLNSDNFFNCNNPFSNKVNIGKEFGVKTQYAINEKSKINLSLSYQRGSYNINLNRSYSIDGFWKPIDGFINTRLGILTLGVDYSRKLYQFKSVKFFSNIGLSYFKPNDYRIMDTYQKTYSGNVFQSPVNDYFAKKIPEGLNFNSACVKIGLDVYYRNFVLNLNLDQGFQNKFSGLFAARRQDGQDFKIFAQSMNICVGYVFKRKAKD
jgi:hypothetical protein